MRLETYLEREGLSLAVFARAMRRWLDEQGEDASGATTETVRRYTLDPSNPDARRPRAAQMRAIYVLTLGEVDPNGMHGLPVLTEQAKRRAQQLIAEVRKSAASAQMMARRKGSVAAARSRATIKRIRGRA